MLKEQKTLIWGDYKEVFKIIFSFKIVLLSGGNNANSVFPSANKLGPLVLSLALIWWHLAHQAGTRELGKIYKNCQTGSKTQDNLKSVFYKS